MRQEEAAAVDEGAPERAHAPAPGEGVPAEAAQDLVSEDVAGEGVDAGAGRRGRPLDFAAGHVSAPVRLPFRSRTCMCVGPAACGCSGWMDIEPSGESSLRLAKALGVSLAVRISSNGRMDGMDFDLDTTLPLEIEAEAHTNHVIRRDESCRVDTDQPRGVR